jgi:hypothetical protein
MRSRSILLALGFVGLPAILVGSACGDDETAPGVGTGGADASYEAAPTPDPSSPDADREAATRSWTGLVPLESGGGAVRTAAVATSKNGDAMVVFEQVGATVDGSAIYDMWAVRYVAATKTWASPVLLETAGGDTSLPDVAMDRNGGATAVWTQDDGAKHVVFAARFTVAGGWAAPDKLLTADAQGAARPRVGMSANGLAVVVWQESDGTRPNIWGARYDTAWSTPARLETSTEPAEFPTVAINANGNGMAVWRQRVSANYRLFGNRWTSTWAGPVPIEASDVSQVDQNFDVGVDDIGNAIAVWSYNVQDNVFTNRYDAVGGGWGTQALLGPGSASNQASPKIGVDSNGNAMAVWRVAAGTDVSSRRYTVSGGWGTTTPIEEAPGVAIFPYVGVDDLGSAVAVWRQTETDAPSVRRVLASRFANGAWAAPLRFDPPDAGNADSARVAVNEAGDAFAIWVQSDGARTNLWANVYR